MATPLGLNSVWGLDEPEPVDPGEPGILGRLAELAGYFRGNGPSLVDKMRASSALFRSNVRQHGLGHAMRDPQQRNIDVDIASNFDFTGILAGKGAKTADLAKLRQAEELEKDFHTPEEIWRATGWFRSPGDRQWRFEIDDSSAAFKDRFGQPILPHETFDRKGSAKSLFGHPELYAAYPELGRIKTEVQASPHVATAGRIRTELDTGKRHIDLFGPDADDLRTSMLHELQHGVQGIERFAPGGLPRSPEQVAQALQQHRRWNRVSGIRHMLDRGMSEAEVLDWYWDYDPGSLDDVRALLRELQPGGASAHLSHEDIRNRLQYWHDRSTSHDYYNRLAGEAEARAVEARRDLTPEQRRKRYPLDDYDVDAGRLIVEPPLQVGPQASIKERPELVRVLINSHRSAWKGFHQAKPQHEGVWSRDDLIRTSPFSKAYNEHAAELERLGVKPRYHADGTVTYEPMLDRLSAEDAFALRRILAELNRGSGSAGGGEVVPLGLGRR